MRSFDEVMAYRNDFVFDVFRRDYTFHEGEIEEIFTVTKQWLFLAATIKALDDDARPLAMPSQIIVADHMWHTFMLCSRDYITFCTTYLDRFVHHRPVGWSEMQSQRAVDGDPVDQRARFQQKELDDGAHVMSSAYDILGPEITTTWFRDIALRYPSDRIQQMRRKL